MKNFKIFRENPDPRYSGGKERALAAPLMQGTCPEPKLWYAMILSSQIKFQQPYMWTEHLAHTFLPPVTWVDDENRIIKFHQGYFRPLNTTLSHIFDVWCYKGQHLSLYVRKLSVPIQPLRIPPLGTIGLNKMCNWMQKRLREKSSKRHKIVVQ